MQSCWLPGLNLSVFESFGHFQAHFSERKRSETLLNSISYVKIRAPVKQKDKMCAPVQAAPAT